MTKKQFQELTKTPLLLDGATGSNMLKAGMPRGSCTETWIAGHKDILLSLQRAYVDAGSAIIYAPTFGANRISLKEHGCTEPVDQLNQLLVSYSKEAADGRAFVAGDITTTGKILGFDDDYEYTDAYDNYCEQIQALVNAGVDLIVAETMISFDETTAAIDACNNVCDLPLMCTMSVNSDGGIFYGGNLIHAATDLADAGADAVGLNCSVAPSHLSSIVRNIAKKVTCPIIAKPNAGLPVIDFEGNATYTLTPEEFAEQTVYLYEQGATILGGCCGTTPGYIRALKQALSKKMRADDLKKAGKAIKATN